MKQRAGVAVWAAVAVMVIGCKKEAEVTVESPPPTPQRPTTGPASGGDRAGAGGAGEHDPSVSPVGDRKVAGLPAGEAKAGEAKVGADAGATPPVEETAAAAAPVPKAADRMERPKLPAAPEDNLLLVIHNAEVTCTAREPVCPQRDLLAAKLPVDMDNALKLLQTGTDQQKRTIRDALVRVRHVDADPLLAMAVIGPDGAIDEAILKHALALRSRAVVLPLLKHLQTAMGAQATLVIRALGQLGGEDAVAALKEALDQKRLAPYRGAICQALAQTLSVDTLDAVAALGARLDGSDRQIRGCRGAEAAFRMRRSGNGPTLNLEGEQVPLTGLLMFQPKEDPLRAELWVMTGPEATCGAPGEPALRLSVPLDRMTEPVVGEGLVPTLQVKDQDLGQVGSFLLEFQQFEMRVGEIAKGAIHLSHILPGAPRVIFSGHFNATWCGVH